MKRIVFLSLSLLVLLGSCGDKDKQTYVPSKFPIDQMKNNYAFDIPFERVNGAIVVEVHLNNGPAFKGMWDSGCTVPLLISSLEAAQLVKQGTLTPYHKLGNMESSIADGSTVTEAVYWLESISFTDANGGKHEVKGVPVCVTENPMVEVLIGTPVMDALGASYEVDNTEFVIHYK